MKNRDRFNAPSDEQRYAEVFSKLKDPDGWDRDGVMCDIRDVADPEAMAVIDFLMMERDVIRKALGV